MSTILKALKRSEASRPRESSLPPAQVPDRPTVRQRRWAPSLAATVVVLAAVGAASWLWWPRTPVDTSGGQEGLRRIAEVSLPARRPAATAPASTPAKSGPESDSPAREVAGPEPSPPRDAPAGADGEASAEGGNASPESTPDPGETGNESPGRDGGSRKPEAGRDREPDGARQELDPYALLPRVEDLEPGRRRELPALDLNVHVHAAEPGQRFVMINLSRYREGDRVAPGLTVAAIFPGGVVLQDGQGRFVLPRP